jgi:hypothetical protein
MKKHSYFCGILFYLASLPINVFGEDEQIKLKDSIWTGLYSNPGKPSLAQADPGDRVYMFFKSDKGDQYDILLDEANNAHLLENILVKCDKKNSRCALFEKKQKIAVLEFHQGRMIIIEPPLIPGEGNPSKKVPFFLKNGSLERVNYDENNRAVKRMKILR